MNLIERDTSKDLSFDKYTETKSVVIVLLDAFKFLLTGKCKLGKRIWGEMLKGIMPVPGYHECRRKLLIIPNCLKQKLQN